MTALAPTLLLALGYLAGLGLGGALAARMRGRSVLAGRRCARCGASLSPVAAAPFLSWFGMRPRCRCGAAAPWRPAALETAAALIGLLAIIALPMPWALLAGAGGFLLFVLAVKRWA